MAAGQCAALAHAQQQAQTPRPPATSAEEAAIKKAAADYLTALRRGDGPALVAAWTADGDYIDASGQRFKARDLIQHGTIGKRGSVAKQEQTEAPPVETDDMTIRFVRPDVAIEDGVSKISGPAGRQIASTRYTAVWVKDKGRWLLDSVRESSAPDLPRENPLAGLEWMVGDWTGKSRDFDILVHVRWVEEQRFIEREFTVKRDQHVVLHGTQLIGWDPATETIKSWAFDSQGGHGEGEWSSDGESWTVDTTGVLGDGKEVESTSTFKLNDDGTMSWTGISPDVPEAESREVEVQFKRRPAEGS